MPASRFGTPRSYPCASSGGASSSHILLPTSYLRFSLSPLTSTLTKNASATPLTSTLTKTKDLKSFIINTYKKGCGLRAIDARQEQCLRVIGARQNDGSPVFFSSITPPVTPLASALTSFASRNPFRFCTYKKHTGGRGVGVGRRNRFAVHSLAPHRKRARGQRGNVKRRATPGNGDLA